MCAPVDIHWLARHSGAPIEQVPLGLGSTATTPLIVELMRRGHEVTVYTLSRELPSELTYRWGNLRLFVGSTRRTGAARNLFRPEIAYLERIIRADAPAFVHAHWTYEFALGALGSGVPTIVTIHDLPWNVLWYFRDRYRTARLLMAYMVAWKGQHFTAVSADAAKHFTRYMRPGATVRSIPNFLTETVLARSTGPRQHPQRPLVFATVLQGWSRRKNPQAALKAFALVRNVSPEVRLVMLGVDYQAGGPAAVWAAKHDLDRGVSFHGALQYDSILDFLRDKADVLVMPSLDEALSMTVLESMALGNPVIAGRSTPGIKEELNNGDTGLLVNVRRPEEIASAMVQLQTKPELFERLSLAAHLRTHTIYTADSVVSQYESLYEHLSATSFLSISTGQRSEAHRC